MSGVERILGVDPGSRITGYGVIEQDGPRLRFISCGVLRVERYGSLAERIYRVHQGLGEVIMTHRPGKMAVEDVFVAGNPKAALKLGHARGVILLAAMQHGLPLAEFTPMMVKQAVAGYGRASKEQVQRMVRALLNLSASPSEDAADALAVAVCGANHRSADCWQLLHQ
ncbi:crossover junction endodeoxyribonuclease RuvC [Desulfurivibrio dismutans]|uniref:crossover junction endodeoxyribonuclease RuvC n=1 Tax=Desulfurivibrio dismutans TaxID=1398908 RepID=UPI003D649D4D